MQGSSRDSREAQAKQYSRIKYSCAIASTIIEMVLVFLFLRSGLAQQVAVALGKASPNIHIILPLYLIVCGGLLYLVLFPLSFYQSFVLEHRFALAHQNVKQWLADYIKGLAVSLVITLLCLHGLYFLVQVFPAMWWWMAAAGWALFAVLLAALFPVLIVPLFFKFTPTTDRDVRLRIRALAEKMQIKILDVFDLNYSAKTAKANAGLMGWGKTRRVVLADTLKNTYTVDEIEAILAHEFAHYRLRHIPFFLLLNTAGSFLFFWLVFVSSRYVLPFFHLPSIGSLGSMPLFLLYAMALGLIAQPFLNAISRAFERQADLMALSVTGMPEAFISLMEKLSAQNLSDTKPHPIVKLFFYDHPPTEERVELARQEIRARAGSS